MMMMTTLMLWSIGTLSMLISIFVSGSDWDNWATFSLMCWLASLISGYCDIKYGSEKHDDIG
jgi:hypothetical protein